MIKTGSSPMKACGFMVDDIPKNIPVKRNRKVARSGGMLVYAAKPQRMGMSIKYSR
jgi:hypothetical protein